MSPQDTRPGNTTTLTVLVPVDIERRLRARATREGRGVEQYILRLIERDTAEGVATAGPYPIGEHALSDEEFGHLLDELSAGPMPTLLPADFSRADVYADHD